MTPEQAADKIYAVTGVILGTDAARHIASYLSVMETRIAELEAALATARRDGMEEAAKLVETHVYTVSNFEPQFRLTLDRRAKDDMHHTTIAAAIRAALEGERDVNSD